MNRQFWLRHRPLPPAAEAADCAQVRPLLSLMSDGMASGKEAALVQAHLSDCADCRQALLWIEATRQAIVARPAVLPPADMRARIARAIAASAGTAVPAVPVAPSAPRRTFTLRPAYAAAASLAAAGVFLAHSLLSGGHAPGSTTPAPTLHLSPVTQGKTLAAVPTFPRKPGAVPAPGVRPHSLFASNTPPAASLSLGAGHGAPAQTVRHAVPAVPRLVARLTPHAAPFVPEQPSARVAVRLPGSAAPHAGPAPGASSLVALGGSPKPPASVHTHLPGQGALLATVPPPHADTPAPLNPGIASPAPFRIAAPAPPTRVARAPESAPAPVRPAPSDPVAPIRMSLASYRSAGFARHLSMASQEHVPMNYVQVPITYLTDPPPARRRTATALRPAAVPQAATPSPSEAPAEAVTLTNQRRSERDKQWSDAPTTGGA